MRNTIVSLLLLACPVVGNAQTNEVKWYEVVGGKRIDYDAKESRTITCAELLANPYVTIGGGPGWTIVSYTFAILPAHGLYAGPYTVNGSEFAEQVVKAIKDSAGDSGRIFIEEVKATGPDGKVRSLMSVIMNYTNYDALYKGDPYTLVSGIPYKYVGGKLEEAVTTCAALLANPVVTGAVPGFKVYSFYLAIMPAHGDYIGPFIGSGPEFTPEMKTAIKNETGRNGKILIEEVKASGPDGKPRILNSVTLRYSN